MDVWRWVCKEFCKSGRREPTMELLTVERYSDGQPCSVISVHGDRSVALEACVWRERARTCARGNICSIDNRVAKAASRIKGL